VGKPSHSKFFELKKKHLKPSATKPFFDQDVPAATPASPRFGPAAFFVLLFFDDTYLKRLFSLEEKNHHLFG
jgi:hypothetical protein